MRTLVVEDDFASFNPAEAIPTFRPYRTADSKELLYILFCF